jgi:C-terminal processing protease CtpA/Prc
MMYRAYQSGEVFCTGIYGNKTLDYFYVADVRPGSPAATAGLKSGDLIKGINGQSIFAKSFWQMYLKLLTRKEGILKLEVLKEESGREVEVEVGTASGVGNFVHKLLEPNIHWLELTCLNEDCYVKLSRFLSTTKPEKIVLDLRWYRGGTFEGFKKIAGLFLAKNNSLKVKTRQATTTIPVGSNNPYSGKIVVVIGQSTLMYGEILAALLNGQGVKPNKRILFFGQDTGRFSARLKHIVMGDGSSILLTEGLYSVNNLAITPKGIQPQVKIKDKDLGRLNELAIEQLNSL